MNSIAYCSKVLNIYLIIIWDSFLIANKTQNSFVKVNPESFPGANQMDHLGKELIVGY